MTGNNMSEISIKESAKPAALYLRWSRNILLSPLIITLLSPLCYITLKLNTESISVTWSLEDIVDYIKSENFDFKDLEDGKIEAFILLSMIPFASMTTSVTAICKATCGQVSSPVIGAVHGYKNTQPEDKRISGFKTKYYSTKMANILCYPAYWAGRGAGITARKIQGRVHST